MHTARLALPTTLHETFLRDRALMGGNMSTEHDRHVGGNAVRTCFTIVITIAELYQIFKNCGTLHGGLDDAFALQEKSL